MKNLYNGVSWRNSDFIVSTLKKSINKVVHHNINTHIDLGMNKLILCGEEINGEYFKRQKTKCMDTSIERSFYISVALEEIMHTLNSYLNIVS